MYKTIVNIVSITDTSGSGGVFKKIILKKLYKDKLYITKLESFSEIVGG